MHSVEMIITKWRLVLHKVHSIRQIEEPTCCTAPTMSYRPLDADLRDMQQKAAAPIECIRSAFRFVLAHAPFGTIACRGAWGNYSNVRREMIDPILDEGQSGQSKCASTWAEQRAGQPSVSKRRKRLVLAGGSKPGFEYTLIRCVNQPLDAHNLTMALESGGTELVYE